MTASWVIAAMIRSEPQRQKGHVAISRANTRPRSLAQLQEGVSSLRLFPVYTLLARRRDNRLSQRAMRRYTAGITDKVDTRQGHDRCQLL